MLSKISNGEMKTLLFLSEDALITLKFQVFSFIKIQLIHLPLSMIVM